MQKAAIRELLQVLSIRDLLGQRTLEPRLVELLSRFPFEETVWQFAEERIENSGKAYWRNVVVEFPRAENLAYAVGRPLDKESGWRI